MAAGISENRGERVMAGNLNLNSAKTARKDEFYAQFAAENLSLNRCMPIILLRGAKAEKQHRIIARCFAATAI